MYQVFSELCSQLFWLGQLKCYLAATKNADESVVLCPDILASIQVLLVDRVQQAATRSFSSTELIPQQSDSCSAITFIASEIEISIVVIVADNIDDFIATDRIKNHLVCMEYVEVHLPIVDVDYWCISACLIVGGVVSSIVVFGGF